MAAILSTAEFETVLADILLTLERVSYEQPHNAPLKQARRDLKLVADAFKTGKPTKLQIEKFNKAGDVARQHANDLDDRLFDLSDYLASID